MLAALTGSNHKHQACKQLCTSKQRVTDPGPGSKVPSVSGELALPLAAAAAGSRKGAVGSRTGAGKGAGAERRAVVSSSTAAFTVSTNTRSSSDWSWPASSMSCVS